MHGIFHRYLDGLRQRAIVFFAILAIAATGTTMAEPLPVGSDGVIVIDAQHPSLYTTLPHDVKAHQDMIDVAAPQRFDITEAGEVTSIGKGATDWAVYVKTLHRRGLKVLPIARNAKWTPPKALLGNPNAARVAVKNLTSLCVEHDFDGLILDIEKLTAADRDPFTGFVTRLNQSFKAHNLLLMVAVGARAWDNQFDFVGLSQNSDALFVMFYDYTGNWTKGNPPGPTAPMAAWPGQPNTIEHDLDALIQMGVPADEIIMGIPEYGVDFILDEQGMVASATPSWNSLLREIARKHDARMKWDEQKQAPYFDYTDERGARHQVWLESARSYRAKLDLARSRGIAGVGTWASVWPDKPTDKAFWPTVKQWLGNASPSTTSSDKSETDASKE